MDESWVTDIEKSTGILLIWNIHPFYNGDNPHVASEGPGGLGSPGRTSTRPCRVSEDKTDGQTHIYRKFPFWGEILNHAKHNNRTVHVTWFDLEDAFGSVSHDLIPICLSRMQLPQNVQDYIVSVF